MGQMDNKIDESMITNCNLEDCYSKISNLIDAEIDNGSKDYDKEYIRMHVNKLTS